MRSPDAAWVERERWEKLTAEQKARFAPLAPDCVAELRSATERLSDLQDKLQDYIANGTQPGWLIAPPERQVWIYRAGRAPELLDNPAVISDALLPGLVLDLRGIF